MTGILCAMVGVGGAASLVVTASNVSGSAQGFSPSGTVNSSSGPNTSVTGGTAPYTYLWEHVSTSSGNTPGVFSATDQNPVWSATVEDGTPSTSIWRVTATDSATITGQATITVNLIWTDLN